VKVSNLDQSIITSGCFALFIFLALFATHYPGWRDSPEFVISGAFLDIAHPAGFPLYSLLANAATHILPFSSITWRISCFSALMLVSCVWLLYQVTRLLAPSTRVVFFGLAALPLILSPSTTRQTLYAEVYTLHAALFLIALWLGVKFEDTLDKRYAILLGFLSGVSLGNHLAMVVPLAVFFIYILFKEKLRHALPFLLIPALLSWLVVYAYLPLRAEEKLPLRSGEPSSFERITNFISDARRRELKDHTPQSSQDRGNFRYIKNIEKNLITLKEEKLLPLYLASFLGLIFLWKNHPERKGLLFALFGVLIGTLQLFSGWSAEPWVISSMIATLFVIILLERLKLSMALIILAFISLPPLISRLPKVIGEYQAIYSSSLSEELGRELLNQAQENGVVITEVSWFLIAHQRYLNGYREDITPIYQPRLLFPYFFEKLLLKVGDKEINFNTKIKETSANFDNLFYFFKAFSADSVITVESSLVINQLLSKVAILNEDGALLLVPGAHARHESANMHNGLDKLFSISQKIKGLPVTLRGDASHHLQSLLVNYVDLLRVLGVKIEEIRQLLNKICDGVCHNKVSSYYSIS
jgi:hypothetical protein